MHSALCACGLGEVGYIRDIRKAGDAEACQFSGSGADKDELGIGGNFLSIGLYGGDCGDSNYGTYGGECVRGDVMW